VDCGAESPVEERLCSLLVPDDCVVELFFAEFG
jgi:hypothetical protein